MAVTRIKNNQITDATVNAAAKLQDFSITSGKIANNLTYQSNLTVTGNLTVQGTSTAIDTTITTIEDPIIVLASTQTSGAPAVDIGFLGFRGDQSNIAFVWDESASSFVTAFTSTAESNTTITITSLANLQVGNLSLTGNILNSALNVTGNITGGNLLTPGLISATANVTGGNVLTGGVVSATANVTGGNVLTGGEVSATANVTGGNVLTGGLISATSTITSAANVTGGNLLTGGLISATSTITSAANITGGNVLTGGLISATANVTGGNLLTGGLISATSTITSAANITGGNLLTGGLISATSTITTTANITGGNILFGSGQVSGTGNVYASNFIGNIAGNIDAAGANTQVQFNDGDLLGASAAFTFDKASNALVNSGNITGGNLLTGGLISAASTITSAANITGGNVLTGGLISATGTITSAANITGGNVLTGGLVSATANITGGNLITGGLVSAAANVTGGNIVTGGLITAAGNVTGGNLLTGGAVSATGNLTANNVNTDNVFSSAGLALVAASGDIAINPSGNVDFTNSYVNNVLDPVQAQDAATKQYVDDAVSTGITIHTPVDLVDTDVNLSGTYAQGGNTFTVNQTIAGNTVVFTTAANLQVNDQLWFSNTFEGIVGNTAYFVVSTPNTSAAVLTTTYNGAAVANITSNTGLSQSVRVNSGQGATLTNNAANAVLVIDGVSTTANLRVLLEAQTTAYENGVYVVTQPGNATTAWVLTRSSDMNTYIPASINGMDAGDYFYVEQGSRAGESHVMTAPVGPVVIGFSNIVFTQFSASQVYSANTAAGISLTGTVFSAKVDNNTTAFDGGGNIIVKAGANLTTPNIGAATGTSLNVTANVTGGNITTAGLITATGNVTGGNVDTAGLITATGNVTGGNVLTGGLISATGTITSAANVIGGNITTAGVVTATGNIQGGNLLTGGLISATSNITGGNLLYGSGIVSGTGNVYAANFIGNISGNIDAGGANTQIQFNDSDVLAGSPGFTFDKTSNAVVANGNITGSNFNTAGLVTATGNITTAGALNGATLSLSGNVTSALNVTGNITGGNILTAGLISTAGNLYVENILNTAGNTQIGMGNGSGIIAVTTAGNTTQFLPGGQVTLGGASRIQGGTFTGSYLTLGTSQTDLAQDRGGNVTVQLGTGGTIANTWTFAQSGAFLAPGAISATGNITGANLILTTGIIDGPAAGRITINGSDIDTDFAVDGDTVANVFYVDAGTGTASFGDSTQITNVIVNFATTTSIKTPVGNTAQRPATGVTGMLRFNTTTNAVEVYDNSQWVSVGVPVFTVIDDEQFNGDGSTVAFTLGSTQTTNSCIVSINGVVQVPTVAYSVSGTDPTCVLTFTEAPLSGDLIDVRQITTTTTVTQISNTSGNAVIAVTDDAAQINITGSVVPSANITYDLGTTSLRWNDLYLAGNSIVLGNTVIKNTSGNTIGFFGPDGTTPATIDAASVDTTTIANGTSSVAVIATGGNIRTNVAGVTVMTVSAGLVDIVGNLSVSGNATLSGNILGDRVQNGTTSIDIQSPNGNANITVGGTSNVAVFATTGAFITGVASVSGNITGGNLSVDTGTVSVGNIVNTNANGVGNIGSTGTRFNQVFALASSAQYADLAEKYTADATYATGTVVAFGGAEEVTISAVDSDRRVAGVISALPSFRMNDGLQSEHTAMVALTGRVPTLVTGPVRKGDMMVSAGAGRARAEANPAIGTVIGKALADHDGADGVIEVVVGRV